MNRFKMFAASLLVLFIIMQFGGNVFAKEEGMKLTVETRELTMDEIPKDRVVKLNVTAESGNGKTNEDNAWKLVADGTEDTIGYNLATEEAPYSSTAESATWSFSSEELDKQGGTTRPMGINVEDYSKKAGGAYSDTVTFTARVFTSESFDTNVDN